MGVFRFLAGSPSTSVDSVNSPAQNHWQKK